jgi:hypothetical protein
MSNEESNFWVPVGVQNYVWEIAGNSPHKLGPSERVHPTIDGFCYAKATSDRPFSRAAFVVFVPSLKQAMTTEDGEMGDSSTDVAILSGSAAKHAIGKSGLSVSDMRLVTRNGAHVALPL